MQLFDQYGANYGETVQRSVDFSGLEYEFFVTAKTNLLKRLVLARHGPDGRPSLLDVGCGIGSMHDHLKDTFGTICGVDVSAVSIETATARNSHNEYRVMAGLQVPYESARFDFVIAVCVFHHVEMAERHKFMIELKRVAQPGGLVCIIEHNPRNPITKLIVSRTPVDADAQLLTAAETGRLLSQAGCEALETRFFLLFPERLHRFTKSLEDTFRAMPFGGQYAVFGRK